MTYKEFHKGLQDFKIFSTRDIEKEFSSFDTRRLVEWQQKGYIQKIINKWYFFADTPMNDWLRFRIGNCLSRPSYISMESALSYYHLIPEGVYTTVSITTKKTITYDTSAGTFLYRSVKPDLFFGYTINNSQAFPVLLAEPEKALLDLLYLNSKIRTIGDLEGMRLNLHALHEIISWEKLNTYAACFDSVVLTKRTRLLKKLQIHAGTF